MADLRLRVHGPGSRGRTTIDGARLTQTDWLTSTSELIMKTNRKMREILDDPAFRLKFHQTITPKKLERLAQSRLFEAEGCMFLALLYSPRYSLNDPSLRDSVIDKTGLECYVNHIHVSDYTPAGSDCDSLDLLVMGLRFAISLDRRLGAVGAHNVILSYDWEECTVRFHGIRPGESYLAADLDGYQFEAILVLSGDGDLTLAP